ncbi:hypothetical protein OUZ56_032949 [Daphnia magna]|uniref:Ricin B lectin domain-containing protein n=1 Tax=Daphnia magna TaxID=35525 RepID=A0ABQ9ZXA4_9CRUS|nr:hypothetical protein OUZ56_032949 [Daphnia magna]
MFKNTIATCLKNTNLATPVCEDYRELYKSRPQRSLLQEVHFLFDTQVENEKLGIRLYSISYAWETLRLAHRRPKIIKEDGKIVQKDATIYITYESGSRNPLTTYSQLSKDDPLPSGSKFEYIVDQTIRIQNTHICITETTHDYIFAAACSEESTRWILEKENSYQISQESEMCLTVGVDETLKLEKCALERDTRKNQQWFFQTISTNPDVIENFSDVTLQDIQEVRLEERRAITTTINSPIFGGILKANHGSGNIIWDMIAWGLLKNGQYANGKCATHHGLEKQLTMEDCDTDWTKCQEELKTFITSNDPLVQSQLSVGNCSKATNKGQAFEYTSDFTIRPFNSNSCVKANTTMLILQECANTSSIWGTFEHTGQLMATDRTGLHSPASDRKCLTLKVVRLSLGHCHGSKDPPVTKNHTSMEDAIKEIIDDTEQTTQQEIPEAACLTLEQVPEVPTKNETESGLPQNIEEFGDKIKFDISKMHEQYKISIETEHENKLAKEIHDVYCQLSTIKKTQAVILAQSNGILAASALGLPICTRLQGFGQAMTLQQCETKRIFISAKESKCGFQPFFTYEDKNCTIGVDGWSIHPYSDCFRKTHLVNLNGFHHTWEHNSTDGEWVKQKASIHMPNLDLITEFEELHLNDFDYSLKSHPAHETMEMEQLNILNDLVGLMQESNSKSISDIVMLEKQDNPLGTMFSWFNTLKILILSIIGFIIFIVCLRILIICDPFTRIMEKNRQARRYRINMEEAHELTSMIPNSSTQPPEEIIEQPFTRMTAPTPLTMERPTQLRKAQPSAPKQRNIYPIMEENWESDQARKCTGKHTTCTYVVGYGMVWEDLCRCSTETESKNN